MHFRNNEMLQRFELVVDAYSEGHTAFADYRLGSDGILHLLHVEAPLPLRGTGAAGTLMQHICEFVRSKQLRIEPVCGYAAAWLQKHPEHHNLRA